MASIRTFSQIVQSMQDNIQLRRPALDTKPGTVARDLFIDNTADQIAIIYRDIQSISKTQSILSSTGQILDQYGSNYGIIRDAGKRATGIAILTFNNIINNISISSGTTVSAKTGIVFRVTANILISAATKSIYSSYASSIAENLHIAGISDQYAIQVPIEAINIGGNGNIPLYSLVSTSIPGISNVTNITVTSGGTNPQSDSQYRNQIIAGLSGSAAGTARGYQNALLLAAGIQSSYIAIPGDPILVRDGTVSQRNSDGTLTVLTPGTGGKIDIWIQGSDFINITESYVFHDISGTGNVASPENAHIFGQLTNISSSLTPLERRNLFTKDLQLPLQPVDSIISLSGSVSGANFVQGINYTIIRDTNPQTSNTAFALDKIIFLQNFISLAGESVAKGNPNNIDTLSFSGIKVIDNIHQSLTVTNDLAILNPNDHTQVTIAHTPITTTLRVTNLSTGERYIITNQNIDQATGLNLTGKINISGSVLPSSQDLVQVDYIWSYEYDSSIDYFNTSNGALPGVDWGKSNLLTMQSGLLVRNNNRYNIVVNKQIDRISTIYYCNSQTVLVQTVVTTGVKALRQITITPGLGTVAYFVLPIDLTGYTIVAGDTILILSDTSFVSRIGTYTILSIIDQDQNQTTIKIDPASKNPIAPALIIETGDTTVKIIRSAVTIVSTISVNGLKTIAEDITFITNIVSVKSDITGLELYATELGGSFSGNIVFLAEDVTQPDVGESVTVYFNSHEIYNIIKNNGSVNGTNAILSTDDILDFNSVLQPLNNIFNNSEIKPIFIDYITNDADLVSRTAIALMPFIGSLALSTFVDKNDSLLSSRQLIEFDTLKSIVRFGPAYLLFTVDGAFSTGGAFSIRGTGWIKINASFQVTQKNVNGVFDLKSIIIANLGTLSNNYSIAKIKSMSINNGILEQVISLRGYALNNNLYDHGFAISSSDINVTSMDIYPIFSQNNITILSIGSVVTITFYVVASNISEPIQFTSGRGTLVSKFKYTRVDRIDLISGFINQSNSQILGNVRVSKTSQPNTGSTYLVDYSYFGPVENERITTQYRYNNIIQDATIAVESVRTLTADVLTRLGFQIIINISMTIILSNQAINQNTQIIDQVTSSVNSLIISLKMGATIDYSSILRVATLINGVDGADVTVFDFEGSEFGGTANRKSIVADADQYFVPGTFNIVAGIR